MKNNIAKAYKFSNSNFRVYQIICDNLHLIPDEQLKTLLAISKFMQNAYPTIETIVKMTGRSRASVFRDIKKLEELNIISVKRKHRQSSVYNLILSLTAMIPKDDFESQKEGSRVSKSEVLSLTAMIPHHINNHINKDIKEEPNINLVDNSEMIEERRKWLANELASRKSRNNNNQ